MRRPAILFIFAFIVTALITAASAHAQQETDWSKVQIKVTKVSGNIYMLEGQGGNIAASVGEDGIVIVDDQFASLADKVQAALKNLGITESPSASSSTLTFTATTRAAISLSRLLVPR